jgi:undecaprenyl-diphosphatase
VNFFSRTFVAAVALWAAFILLTMLVLTNVQLFGDLNLAPWIQARSWWPLSATFAFISWLTGVGQVALSVVLVGLVASVNRRLTPFALAAVSGNALGWLINVALQVPRPTEGAINVLEHPGAYAYPSGHAALVVTVVVVTILCVLPRFFRPGMLVVAAVIGLLAILTVGIERVYVGVHYPSDVIGGFLFSSAWLCLALSVRVLGGPVFQQFPVRHADQRRMPVELPVAPEPALP